MKHIQLVFVLLFAFSVKANASDQYYKSNATWHKPVKISDHIIVQSVHRLDKWDYQEIKSVYDETKKLFFNYWSLSENQCSFGEFKIKIVRDHYDLNNIEFFPNETDYADPPGKGNGVIFGRYYRISNTLYVVKPDNVQWYWKRDFSHEVLHYLFDECKIYFINDEKEHEAVYKFLRIHKTTFE